MKTFNLAKLPYIFLAALLYAIAASFDATSNWVVVKTEQPISVVSGRFVQCRITLRSNDVGA